MNFILSGAAAANSSWIMIIAFLALIGFTYFTMMRPQKKQQQQRMAMMKALKKGDEVIMISGLYGKIDQVDEAKGLIVLDADGIFLTFSLNSVREVVNQTTPAQAPQTNVPVASETTTVEPKSETSEAQSEAPTSETPTLETPNSDVK